MDGFKNWDDVKELFFDNEVILILLWQGDAAALGHMLENNNKLERFIFDQNGK